MPGPSAIDLTTIANVASWVAAGANTPSDPNIQACITAWSLSFLWRTGRADQSGDVPAKSPFVEPVVYNDNYDGNNNTRMFLRNWPVVSVQSLSIGTLSVPASSGVTSWGYVIDGNGRSISLRTGLGAASGYGFSFQSLGAMRGSNPRSGLRFWGDDLSPMNVNVQYTAGFSAIPPDVELCARKVAALNWKRRNWIDQKSQAMASGAGTVTYRDWEIPPECERVVRYYARNAIV